MYYVASKFFAPPPPVHHRFSLKTKKQSPAIYAIKISVKWPAIE